MNLPFSTEQFLSVFEQYNRSVWPLQILFNFLGLGVLSLAIRRFIFSDKIISGVLVSFWLWIGIAYHIAFFSSINPAAYAFAFLNIIQGIIFLFFGVIKNQLSFRYRSDFYGITGTLFILYALVVYPVLGYFSGHVYPYAPTFGLPCPTTIFTFGILLWTNFRVPKTVLVIPLLWSLIGFSAAIKLGISEDIGLLIAGVVGSALIVFRDKNASKPAMRTGQAA